jgi:tRNA G18 (ribose-2'-O)-methylase SpoU
MPEIVRVLSAADPRLVPYAALRERELRTLPEARDARLFVAEGRLVFERLLESRHRVRSLFVSEERLPELAPLLARLEPGVPVLVASRELHERVSGVAFHQGLLALGEAAPDPTLADLAARCTRLVVLESVNNHDNIGTVLRNLAALCGPSGGLLCDPRCADPLYRKAIRVSMGWALHVPTARAETWPGALAQLKSAGFRLLALTPRADARLIGELTGAGKLALLFGAEGPGLSPEALACADERVRIAIAPEVDSLNLASACAIALHSFASPR